MRFVFALILALSALTAGGVNIPTNRMVFTLGDAGGPKWQAGVRGGIVPRTTIFTNHATTATAAMIQHSLDTCPSNQVVMLTNGTFTMNDVLIVPSYVTLRGHGITNTSPSDYTLLKWTSGGNTDGLIGFDNNFDDTWGATVRTLTNCVQGSTNIGTTVAHGWTAGDIVLIDMKGNNGVGIAGASPPITNAGSLGTATWVGRESGVRCIGQWVEILTVPTIYTATIDTPLYWSYTNTPQGVEMTGITKYAGIESLTIDNLTTANNPTLGLFGAVNCWATNVEFRGNYYKTCWSYGAHRWSLLHCYIKGNAPIGNDRDAQYDSQRAYGWFMGPHTSASLFQDNIFEKLTLGFGYEGAAAGNVFAYNLITNIWWKDTGDSPRRFGPLVHGPHPFMNLYEGIWTSDRVRSDEYWGTSSHLTVLRSVVQQHDRGSDDSQTWTVDIERNTWYVSFIGNLIGGSATVSEDNYEFINGESAPYSDTHSTIWKIGYKSLGDDNTLYDSGTLTNFIRWGNWSYRTNDSTSGSGMVWHDQGIVDTSDKAIPNSFYLSAKPAWFGSLAWPPYNPTNSSDAARSMTNIPAGYRYVYGAEVPTQDTTPPTIINLSSGSPGNTSATITYDVDESCTNFWVTYSLNSSLSSSVSVTNSTTGTSTSVGLSLLSSGTTYYYAAYAVDVSGNTGQSSTNNFQTTTPAVTSLIVLGKTARGRL